MCLDYSQVIIGVLGFRTAVLLFVPSASLSGFVLSLCMVIFSDCSGVTM